MVKHNKGFTLLELMMVLGIITLMAVTQIQDQARSIEQARARQLGIQIYQYNNAVRRWLAANIGASASQNGNAWLKDTSCGGTAVTAYLPCSFPDALPLGGLVPSTEVTTSSGVTQAVTTLPALMLSGDIRPDLAGLAALTASGGAINNLLPTMAATDGSFTSDPNTAVITLEASTNGSSDVWLRTDGGNSMHNNLNFDSGNSTRRNITGVNRITSLANNLLRLGNGAINADVLIDADAEVVGNLVARSNLQVRGNASVDGNVNVDGDVDVDGTITSDENITAAGNLRAGNQVFGRSFMDTTTGTSYWVDPSGRSHMNRIDLAGNLYDADNTGYRLDLDGETVLQNMRLYGRIYDGSNNAYGLDPSATNRMNIVDADRVRMRGTYTNGQACTFGTVGINAAGEMMSCVGSQMRRVGTPEFTISYGTSFAQGIGGFVRYRDLGYHHYCTKGGVSQTNSGDYLASYVWPDWGTALADGRHRWTLVQAHEQWDSYDHVTCFTLN